MKARLRMLVLLAAMCLLASMAAAAEPARFFAEPAPVLKITKAMVGKVDVTHRLASKARNNSLVVVATSEFLGLDPGQEKVVVNYVVDDEDGLDAEEHSVELSPIPGDTLSLSTPAADWVRGVAVLTAKGPVPGTAAAEKSPPEKGLVVKFAIYGNGGFWADVTEPCKAAITNDTLTIEASNSLAGDPISGPKIMLVAYVLDGRAGAIGCEERQKITISSAVEAQQRELASLPTSKATFTRKIERRNTDLHRFIPCDGNTVYNAIGLLRNWPAGGPKELWRLKTGPSLGATVEAGGRAFATGQNAADGKQYASCVDAKTGSLVWKAELAPEYMLPYHWWGTVASPLVDGDRVYFIPYVRAGDYKTNGADVHQNNDDICPLVCLRASDGKEMWRSGGEIPLVNGFSTPLVVGDTLFVLPKIEKHVVAALDKVSGKLLWTGTTDRPAKGVPYAGASPTYLELEGVPQLVMGLGSNTIAGVSVENGSILWRIDRHMGHGLLSSAVASADRLFISCGENKFSMCVEISKRDGSYVPRTVYQSSKNQVNWFLTPPVHEGAVYGFGANRLQCTSLDTGEILWEHVNRKDWGERQQLIVADGLIFALTKSGDLVMAEANKTGYKELGRVPLDIEIQHFQQPTLANGRLYVRGFDTVVCYQLTADLLDTEPDTGSAVPSP